MDKRRTAAEAGLRTNLRGYSTDYDTSLSFECDTSPFSDALLLLDFGGSKLYTGWTGCATAFWLVGSRLGLYYLAKGIDTGLSYETRSAL